MKPKSFIVLFSALAVFGIIMSACAPAATAAPAAPAAPAAVATTAPAAPAATATSVPPTPTPRPPYDPASFTGDVVGDCKNGQILKEIAAVDSLTVKFSLCQPEPAFREKVAFSAFSIQPKAYLEKAIVDHSILEKPVGTGPYMLDSWKRGESVTFKRFDGYWGDKAKTSTLVFRWSKEGAARLLELQSGTVDGIDNPSPDDFTKIAADSSLKLYPREANNVLYFGMTNTFAPFDKKEVRQAIAMGIDRDRIVKNFYPAGSTVADYFTPCSIVNACVGNKWYSFDAAAAKALLAKAGYPDGFKTHIYIRDVVRSYMPDPQVIATELQAQLKANLNIDADIVVLESGKMVTDSQNGALSGIHLLGWNGDYPHISDWLNYFFTESNNEWGKPYPDIYKPLDTGASMADPKKAESYYLAANNAIKDEVPMIPVVHGGSATVFKADVVGAHASPLGDEYFAVMKPGNRDTFVWMQNAEPLSLYCNDETDGESIRACNQVLESLLSFEVGGTAVKPGLATSCDPNADLTVWTCHLRPNVKFHDGSTLTANDVVMSWQVAWDYNHPLHIGNTGAFEYFTTLWGNLLNAPPAS